MNEGAFPDCIRYATKSIRFPGINAANARSPMGYSVANNPTIHSFILQGMRIFDENNLPQRNAATNHYTCRRHGSIPPEHLILANRITSFLAMNDPNMDIRSQDVLENWRQFHQAAVANNLNPIILASFHTLNVDGTSKTVKKNATRENSSTLKAWLHEHKSNPYPSKGEKILLALLTQMTLTQVSTWFANARRRLKKEKKGEWTLQDKYENAESVTESMSSVRSVSDMESSCKKDNDKMLKKPIWSIVDLISPAKIGDSQN